MPTLPAPFSIITPQATLEALDKAKADLPLDFLRTFTINPLLMYPCSHAVLVPITACSMQRYNSASMLDPGITRLAEYFALKDGAKWRGNLPWNWAVGIVRTGKDKLPREYNSEEPLITIETADGLVVDVLMGGHLITATGSAGSILSMAGKHAAAQAFQFFPMYLFPNELSTVITGQFLTEVALLDNLKHDLARINNPDSTMTLVMTAIVEKACRLSDSPISSNWDSAMSYPSLWETLNRALECSPDAELPFGSEKRELRCAMVDLIRNLDVWLPLAKLLTNLVPCTAKPGFNELGTVLRQTSTLEWVKILLGVFNMRYQPVTMWSAMDAVQVHIACGNPFVTNADVYSKIGPADNNTYCSLFDATAGLRNESHGLLVDGKTMWDGFRKVQLDNNPRFGTFVSLADMGRFRRWDHGFVSAIGCFALAHWIIFGTTIYNMISGTRRTYRNLKTHRKNADSDNFYEYIKAHTPPAFFMRLNRMAETAARQSNIAHFPKNFWTELLTPSFEVPSAYTPPKVKMPDVMPSLVWGRDSVPQPLAIFPGLGAGLTHALHTSTTTSLDSDGFGGLFRLLHHETVLKGIQELKQAKMVPAGLPETAGTRWKKVEEYIPRPRTPSPPADPPAPDAPVAVPNVPMPMPDVPVPVRDIGLPVRAASRLRKTTPPAASDLFNNKKRPAAPPKPEQDLSQRIKDELKMEPTGELPGAEDVPPVKELEPKAEEKETDAGLMTPVADVSVLCTKEEDVLSPLLSTAKIPHNVPSLGSTEPLTAATPKKETFAKKLSTLLTQAADPDDESEGDVPDPTTPPNEASMLASPMSLALSPLFSEEESDEVDEEEHMRTMMRALKGSADYARIYADIQASFAALRRQMPVPRLPKRSRSAAASTVASPAVGRVYKKKREDVD